MSCHPDYVVLGMSAETFWDGLEGSRVLQRKLDRVAKCGVVMGSDACQAALRKYGRGIKRLGVITPYMPIGDTGAENSELDPVTERPAALRVSHE